MTTTLVAELADDEFSVDRPAGAAALCQESIELTDADLAELVRLPWRHDQLYLDTGPAPVLRCAHEDDHAGRHVAFGAEGGGFKVWVAWDGTGTRIFPADYCPREAATGDLCILHDQHQGRHAIGG